MKLYYSDVLSPHEACAVARYLKSPVEFVYLDLGRPRTTRTGELTLGPSRLIPRAGQAATWDPATANDFLRL
jgi:glutathione S-transferase